MVQVSMSSLDVMLSVSSQLETYIAEVQDGELSVLMPLCSGMPDVLQELHGFNLICAPASQGYVERIFSVCGLLHSGR